MWADESAMGTMNRPLRTAEVFCQPSHAMDETPVGADSSCPSPIHRPARCRSNWSNIIIGPPISKCIF